MAASRSAAAGPDRCSRRGAQPNRLDRSRPIQWLVRAGFAVRALTYSVIAGLAIAVAAGVSVRPASPNPQGALALIVHAPLGRLDLAIISIAVLAYALWKLLQCVRGRGPEGGGGHQIKARLGNLGGGLVYLEFFWVAITVLTGNAGNGSAQPRQTAAGLLALPGGAVAVGIAAIGLIVTSIYQAYDAISGRFVQDNKIEQMTVNRWRVFMLIGRIGIFVRAGIFCLVGYFLLRAALELRARAAAGVDGALATVHQQPLGPWLLALVGAGLLTFAAFSLLEARYRRL